MDQTVPLPDYEPLFRLSVDHISFYLTILLPFCGAVFFLRSQSEAAYKRFSLVVYWVAAVSVLFGGYLSIMTTTIYSDSVISEIQEFDTLISSDPQINKIGIEFALETAYFIKSIAQAVLHIAISFAALILLMWVTAYVAVGIFEDDEETIKPKPGEDGAEKSE